MAKHPHRLILLEKRTWRCTLDGCSFFVHLGLQHVLLGKRAVCWECDEIFTLTEQSLKSETPKCLECSTGQKKEPSMAVPIVDLESMIEKDMAGRLSAKLKGEEYIPDEVKITDTGDEIESYNPIEESNDGEDFIG